MNKKSMSSLALIVSLLGLLSLSVRIPSVNSALPYIIVTIEADGSISPTFPNITTLDNVTYTFTANITAPIIVQRSDIVIDGDGWTLDGADFAIWEGFNLTSVSNVTLVNVNIERFASYSILLNLASQCVISRNTVTGSEGGIGLFSSTGNTVSNNVITGCYEAVELRSSSSGNVVSENNITDNACGVVLANSVDNTIAGNDMKANNFAGMQLGGSNFNTISGNNITNSNRGILLNYASSNNTISGNNIANNNYNGIYVTASSNNTFYHNDFINNTQQVYDSAWDYPQYDPSTNVWDDDYPSCGNYWSNYTGIDANIDGIGDSSHEIYPTNIDHYPLMGPFNSFNTTMGLPVNVVSNSTIEGFQYFESNSTIKMYVSNMTTDQTHGFCRISIPYEVMFEPFNVTIDGANPTYWNYTLCDDGKNKWIYFEYEHTTRKIVIIPELPSFLILPLFILATLLTAIAYKKT